jgi:hypothetical protein
MPTQETNMKFNTHHFPVGTVFEIRKTIAHFNNKRTIWPCQKVVRNGAKSYVIDTGITHESVCFDAATTVAFNIEHVVAIHSRGTGPVIIDHGYEGIHVNKGIYNDMERMEVRSPIHSDYGNHEAVFIPRQRNYNTGSVKSVVMHELLKVLPVGSHVDYSRLNNAVCDQTWTSSYSENIFGITCINKKRLRAWLKQNANRFLKKVSESEKEYEEFMEKEDNRIFDDKFDYDYDNEFEY